MKKIVLMFSFSAVRSCGLSFFLLCAAGALRAQTDCVDYDVSSYPKTIEGKEYYWNSAAWNFTNLKQTKRSGLNIANNFKGLLEYLPASYNAQGNSQKKYPVIIFFHGFASKGLGTAADLCRLFKDKGLDMATHLSIPGRVERQTANFTQSDGETTQEFIVISPQFSSYNRPATYNSTDNYPSADAVEDVIDYVEAHYRIDKRRIYLTGLSNGANMITEYAGSSVERAKRIAALMPVSLCSQMNHISNTDRKITGKNIGLAKLKTWFVYCEADNCGSGPALKVSNDWVNAIKSVPGSIAPRFTILTKSGAATATLYNCSDTLLHDAWSRAYDPNFKASFINYTYNSNGDVTGKTNDNTNENIYQWFAQSQSAILPVKLKEFTARLSNGKVELKWITTDEKDNASFTIERAGSDQRFSGIANIPGAINNIGEKAYAYTDANPLNDLSFYRLVQTDLDGTKTYFDIRRILNEKGNINAVVVSPNPFTSDLSAFLTVDRSQKVSISLTDMNGRIVKTSVGIYSPGTTEIKIGSGDLVKGVYLLKISGENFSSSKKVIKN